MIFHIPICTAHTSNQIRAHLQTQTTLLYVAEIKVGIEHGHVKLHTTRLVEHCATYILYAFRFLLSALSWSPKPHRLHSLHAQPRTPCAFSDTQHRDKREVYRRNLMDIVSCTPPKKRHPAIR